MKLGYALAAVASLALAAPASAATLQVLGTVQDGDSYTNVTPATRFEDGVSAFVDVAGTNVPFYRDVYTGTDLAGVGLFNAITMAGTMNYVLSNMPSTFRMIWGSVDAGNILTLNLVGGGTEVVTGQDLLDQNDVPVDAGTTNVIVQIASAFNIASVTLTTPTVDSFEHAFNPPEVPVAPVPVPAAGLLLLTAMGGMGFVARRRKSA